MSKLLDALPQLFGPISLGIPNKSRTQPQIELFLRKLILQTKNIISDAKSREMSVLSLLISGKIRYITGLSSANSSSSDLAAWIASQQRNLSKRFGGECIDSVNGLFDI